MVWSGSPCKAGIQHREAQLLQHGQQPRPGPPEQMLRCPYLAALLCLAVICTSAWSSGPVAGRTRKWHVWWTWGGWGGAVSGVMEPCSSSCLQGQSPWHVRMDVRNDARLKV